MTATTTATLGRFVWHELLTTADMGARPNWLPYIEAPDVDATIAQAASLGATVLVQAQTVAEVGRFSILQDPQGAAFAIITPELPNAPETDPAPLEFSWHELATSDAQAALAFYEKLFGWESKGESDMGDDKGTYRMFGRDRFTYGGAIDTSLPPHWMSYVTVADSADAAMERAKSAGGTVVLDPVDVPGGDRIAIMLDPQGASFAVHSKTAS